MKISLCHDLPGIIYLNYIVNSCCNGLIVFTYLPKSYNGVLAWIVKPKIILISDKKWCLKSTGKSGFK